MFDGLVAFAMDRWRHDCGARRVRIISRPGSPMSEGRFDLSTFRSECRNEASTLTITPKRSSLRDVDDLRVCSFCCKLVLSCVQSLDSSQQTEDDSQSFRESQQKKFRFDSQSESLPSPKQSITSPARRKSSVIGFREEDFAKAKPFKSALESLTCRERTQKIDGPIQDRAHLKQLMHQLLNSVQSVSLWKQEYKDHHTKVILGCDIVDWLVEHDATLSR
ncbi:1-phosphatidylinositol 3-phosphate 5-kinase [Trichonephila clavipes]|nr:1-phosphatidylinositol 3-phosphate 5-kinase [Trichonephila clavipes]